MNGIALELTADTNPFNKAMESAQQSLNKFTDAADTAGHAVGGSLGKAIDNFINVSKGGVAAAGAFAGGLVAAASSAVAVTLAAGKQAEALDHLSQKTGISTRTLQSWSVIMAQNNFQAESLTAGMRTLSKQVIDAQDPSSKAAAAFEEMGLSIENLGSTESVIRAVADRFKDMADGPEKARMAIQLFGKAGLELVPILNKGAKAFDESRKDAERFGLVLSTTQMDALTAADDAVDRLGASFDGLKTRIALVFANNVTSGINALTEGMVKLTTITTNYSKALDEVKKDHAILSSLFPAGAAAMAAVKASQMPMPSPPPEVPQGPDQNAHIVAHLAQGEKQEQLGRKLLGQHLHKIHLLKAEQNAQEALGRTIVQMTQSQLGALTSEEKAQEALGRTMLQIHQRQRDDMTKELDLYFQTEQKLSVITEQEALGAKIVQQATDAWKHRNDVLEMAVDRAKVLDEAQQAMFATEHALFGASDAAREKRMQLIEAEGALRKREIEESILDEQRRKAALENLDIELDTKRRQTVQSYPTFFQQQMKAIVDSNAFSIAQITTTWTSGLANAAVNGGNFVEQAWKSTQVAVLQGMLNLGVQIIAREALTASVRFGIISAAAAAEMGLNTAKNATIVAGDAAAAGATVSIWGSAAAAITGTFGVITGAISGFFTGTIIPMFVTLGEVLTTFLSAIATSLDISIFGAPFSVPIWAAVGLMAAAIGVISAFAFAEGGIVTGPTMGLVGEAGSSEAVIPLNKRGAAFMREAMGGGGGRGGPLTVNVELDGRILAKAVFENMQSVMHMRGVRL
jgi:hypothetical protein